MVELGLGRDRSRKKALCMIMLVAEERSESRK
jgi:hypothetical protein